MKIYTKTGDKGQTGLYDGTRIDKDSLRVESYGTIDELDSSLGFARNFIEDHEVIGIIYKIQRDLFDVSAELATLDKKKIPKEISEEHVTYLENVIDTYIDKIPKIDKFIIPGSNKSCAALHVSRTICRRAERRILTLSRNEDINPLLIKYVNRLSDCIYSIARFLETDLMYINFDK
jgi:cob(I)alamin adenosyltransferase